MFPDSDLDYVSASQLDSQSNANTPGRQDTLIAMGIVNGPKRAGHGLGSECTGVVSAIGPDVTDFKIGDRVMAITADAYATTTKTAAYMAHKLPDGVSFEDGATMICVYFTAIHGLINLARLEKGQVSPRSMLCRYHARHRRRHTYLLLE